MTNIIKNLPWNADQFSFGLTYKTAEDEIADIELTCVCFNRQGTVTDAVGNGKNAMLKNSVITNFDKTLFPPNMMAAEGDALIHAFPKHICPPYEVFAFVASAPLLPGKANDLNSSTALTFTVTDPEGKTSYDLKPHVLGAHALGSQGLGSGQQSIVIATMFQDGKHPGWTLHFNFSTYNSDSWGMIVPDMKKIIVDIYNAHKIELDCAKNMVISPNDRMVVSRQFQDMSLVGMAKQMAASEEAAAAPVTKIRIDLSWAPYTEPGQPEDEVEEWSPEFNLAFVNVEGEEVAAVGSGADEAEGLKVGLPEAEEVEEEEKEEKEEEEDEEKEEGEGEGEEENFPPPKEEPPEDPHAFPLKNRIEMTLPELPADITAGTLIFSNFTDTGFTALKYIKVKVYNISANPEDPVPMGSYSVLSKRNGDKTKTQVVLLKMYKEFATSAFEMWKKAGVDDMEEYLSGSVDVVADMKEALEAHKKLKAADEAAAKKAEEDGEDAPADSRPYDWRITVVGLLLGGASTEDVEHDIKNVLSYQGPLVADEKRSYDAARVSYPNKDSYFGGYADDFKSGKGLYTFANGAIYIGEYLAGKRHGTGKMVMPDGGLYEGQLANDKFESLGRYQYPDGSVYTGDWKAGKKHGRGVYWDTTGGCLHGSWDKGVLKGEAHYDQPAYHYEGTFVRGIPAGPATFTICPHRTLDMPKFAATHIMAENGPSLSQSTVYSIPVGAEVEPPEGEDGEEAPVDDDKPGLPAFPKYEGLAMNITVPAIEGLCLSFPPLDGLPVPISNVPKFSVEGGFEPATVEAL